GPADTLVGSVLARFGCQPERVRYVPIKIAIAVALASLAWFGIERPILRWKRYFVPRRALAVAALVAGCHGSPAVPAEDDAARPGIVVAFADAAVVDVEVGVDATPPPAGRVLYLEDRTQSPITPAIAA